MATWNTRGRGSFTAGVMLARGLAAVLAGRALAQGEEEHGTLSVLFENDYFFHTDRDYSNGVEFAWTTAPSDTPQWSVDLAPLPFFGQQGEVRASYALGQNIYTPVDLSLPDPPLTERPYAGYLYLTYGLAEKSEMTLDQLQVQLGVVGPDSLAEETQKFVHRIIGDTTPQGWDTQLHNEPAFVIGDERAWKAVVSGSVLGFSFDVAPHVGGMVGTVYDFANAGAIARFGLLARQPDLRCARIDSRD